MPILAYSVSSRQARIPFDVSVSPACALRCSHAKTQRRAGEARRGTGLGLLNIGRVLLCGSASLRKHAIKAVALRPRARGSQGLPERRAPAGEPVAGPEAAGSSGGRPGVRASRLRRGARRRRETLAAPAPGTQIERLQQSFSSQRTTPSSQGLCVRDVWAQSSSGAVRQLNE